MNNNDRSVSAHELMRSWTSEASKKKSSSDEYEHDVVLRFVLLWLAFNVYYSGNTETKERCRCIYSVIDNLQEFNMKELRKNSAFNFIKDAGIHSSYVRCEGSLSSGYGGGES